MTRATIVLPTRTWTPTCEELKDQLTATDELLIVCDVDSDPVVDRVGDSENVQVIVSGEPEACSGKANAVAAGLEAAAGDIIVCTDGDFSHRKGWLELVVERVKTDGVVSTIPIFRSAGPVGALLEPIYAVLAIPVLLGPGQLWGGLIGFERDRINIESVVTDLRRTVGDDFAIGEHVDDVTLIRSLTAEVLIDGTFSDVTDRTVRFCRQFQYYTPLVFWVIFFALFATTVALAFAPLVTATVLIAIAGLTYVGLRYWRFTFVLIPIAVPVLFTMCVYSLFQPEFEWGGRRYRWTGKYEVDLVQ